MVYDKKHRLIVLFGGDAQDSALADTWVFDVAKQQWQMRRPKQSPYPRSCHAMAYLDGSGVVLLAGGRVVADYRRQRALSEQVWAYDAGTDVWTPVAARPPAMEGHEWYSMENIPGTDEVLLVVTSQYDHRQVTYRFRYDPAAPPPADVKLAQIEGVPPGTVAFKTERTPAVVRRRAAGRPPGAGQGTCRPCRSTAGSRRSRPSRPRAAPGEPRCSTPIAAWP